MLKFDMLSGPGAREFFWVFIALLVSVEMRGAWAVVFGLNLCRFFNDFPV